MTNIQIIMEINNHNAAKDSGGTGITSRMGSIVGLKLFEDHFHNFSGPEQRNRYTTGELDCMICCLRLKRNGFWCNGTARGS